MRAVAALLAVIWLAPLAWALDTALKPEQSSYGVRHAQVLAAALLGGLPLVALFLAFQRQLVTAIKG